MTCRFRTVPAPQTASLAQIGASRAAHPDHGRSGRRGRKILPRQPLRAAPSPDTAPDPGPWVAATRRSPRRCPPRRCPLATGADPRRKISTGAPPSCRSTSVMGPSSVKSICCHSRVGSSPSSGPMRAEKIRLFKYSANRYSVCTFRGGLPVGRQQTDHRLTTGTGLAQRILPPHTRPKPAVPVQIQEDLVAQRGILLDQPLPQRNRVPIVPAGMTHEDARHTITADELIRGRPGHRRVGGDPAENPSAASLRDHRDRFADIAGTGTGVSLIASSPRPRRKQQNPGYLVARQRRRLNYKSAPPPCLGVGAHGRLGGWFTSAARAGLVTPPRTARPWAVPQVLLAGSILAVPLSGQDTPNVPRTDGTGTAAADF